MSAAVVILDPRHGHALPVEGFLGKHRGSAFVGVVATQVAWGVALVAVGRLVLRRAVRRLVVQGG